MLSYYFWIYLRSKLVKIQAHLGWLSWFLTWQHTHAERRWRMCGSHIWGVLVSILYSLATWWYALNSFLYMAKHFLSLSHVGLSWEFYCCCLHGHIQEHLFVRCQSSSIADGGGRRARFSKKKFGPHFKHFPTRQHFNH